MSIEEIIKMCNYSSTIWQIITPLIFSFADIITGFIQALINNNIESRKMRIGLLHKILIVIVIILSFVIDFAFNFRYFSKIVTIYVIVMEIMSIAENLKKAGINITGLTKILKISESEVKRNENE